MSIADTTQDVGTRIMVAGGASCSVCLKHWNSDIGLYQLTRKQSLKLK